MRRFRFELETVLRHRRILESQHLQRLAAVQSELRACDARIARLRADAERALREWPGVVDLLDFAMRELYLEAVGARIEQEERVREGIAARMEEARLALVRARQDRETIERVREGAYREYLHEAERANQQALDEIATVRHAHAVAGGGITP